MNHRHRFALPLLACSLVVVSLLSLGTGAAGMSPLETLRALAAGPPGDASDLAGNVVWSLRLPRLLLALLAGAALSSAGTALRTLVRNPLAEPGLLGVSAGATLGAAFVLVALPGLTGVPLASITALAAALAAGAVCGLALFLARSRDGEVGVTRLLLSGTALNALAGGSLGLLLTLASDLQLRSLAFWTLGSLSRADWPSVLVLAAVTLPGVALLLARSRTLDALSLGESGAAHLGVNVRRLKRELILVSAILAGTVTALCGVIGFIGLTAPHLVRLILGSSHRLLVPCGALAGALLLVLADLAARLPSGGSELPVGAVTALLGAPLFLFLLRRCHV